MPAALPALRHLIMLWGCSSRVAAADKLLLITPGVRKEGRYKHRQGLLIYLV